MQRGELIEVNSNRHSDYTYHRHSAPKDVIYYRCSDKRCKARFHFNTKTKEYRLKNQHLDAAVHKPPKFGGAKKLVLGGDGQQEEKRGGEELKCEELLPSLDGGIRHWRRPIGGVMSMQLSVPTAVDGHLLCQRAVSTSLAFQACYMERGVIYCVENQRLVARDRGVHVCLEVPVGSEPFVQDFIRREMGFCPEINMYMLVPQKDVTT